MDMWYKAFCTQALPGKRVGSDGERRAEHIEQGGKETVSLGEGGGVILLVIKSKHEGIHVCKILTFLYMLHTTPHPCPLPPHTHTHTYIHTYHLPS